MVTIISQTLESTNVFVEFKFQVNCNHVSYHQFTTNYEQGSLEFNQMLEQMRLDYESNFKNSPDFSTKDTNVNRGTIEVLTFENGVGTAKIEFNVIGAEVSSAQPYSLNAELTEEQKQVSILEQTGQYEVNYKNGNSLTDL